MNFTIRLTSRLAENSDLSINNLGDLKPNRFNDIRIFPNLITLQPKGAISTRGKLIGNLMNRKKNKLS